jgi:hypothetical protein
MGDIMCSNQELQDQIIKLSKDNNKAHKEITAVLTAWTPLIRNYEAECSRARAYKLVAEDLKTKGASWKFWLALVSVILGILSAIFFLAERIKIGK